MEGVARRSVEDVQEWILEHIREWISDYDTTGELDSDTRSKLDTIYAKIEDNQMLSKSEAKILHDNLLGDLRWVLANEHHDINRITLSDIDSLSIYADAWGLYCRPGTYHI